MFSVSSLRRMIHSMSLRARGSVIDFCSSVACAVLPLRAAAIASLAAAMSVAGVEEVGALANGAEAAEGRPAVVVDFAFDGASLALVALSLAIFSRAWSFTVAFFG